jgi:hypothetical protein
LQYLHAQRTSKPGKQPTDSRPEGLAAADEREKTGLSWPQIANRVCRCGNLVHSRKCAERLRGQKTELENFLARLSA